MSSIDGHELNAQIRPWQVWSSAHPPHEPPHPSSPHSSLAEQFGAQHDPSKQVSPGWQEPSEQLHVPLWQTPLQHSLSCSQCSPESQQSPHVPPQPLLPQLLPAQLGAQQTPSWQV